MPFAALDDEFFGHPKTSKAGNDGAGLYARALSYCAHYLTDGFVPLAWAKEIARPAVRAKVTAAGFWVEVEGGERYEYVSGTDSYVVEVTEPGYFIPDYLAFNPTREVVEAKRNELSEKRAAAGRKGAAVRWQRQRVAMPKDGKTDGKTMASGWPPSPAPKELSLRAVSVVSREQPSVTKQINDSLKEVS